MVARLALLATGTLNAITRLAQALQRERADLFGRNVSCECRVDALIDEDLASLASAQTYPES